jgi:hypothetical protein
MMKPLRIRVLGLSNGWIIWYKTKLSTLGTTEINPVYYRS